jgi:hypothetical protein
MSRYRKKPVVIEAWPVDEINRAFVTDHWEGLPDCIREAYGEGGWVPGALKDGVRGIYVPTLEGSLFAAPGDWIIRGVRGEFYPCKPDVFEATYEPAEADA